MIEAGIDEVTMILLPVSELLNSPDRRWYDIANEMVFEAEDKLNLLDLFGERKYMNNGFKLWTLILFIQFLPVCMWLSRLLCLLTFCLMLFSLSESFFSRA